MSDTSSTPIRILYIDDDVAFARLVHRYFERRGIEIVHAAGFDVAVDRLDKGGISVIALDHFLPEGNGLQLMARLSNHPHSPPIVYVTGSSDMNVAVAALKAGAADFVPKGIGEDFFELLKSAFDQALEKARLRSEKEAADIEVRTARDRAEMLVHEVNHRVANSLALVSAMVTLQIGALSDEAGRTALREMQSRIYAIAMVHKRLYTSQSVGTVELHDYLSSLLDYLRTTMNEKGSGGSLHVKLEPLECATDFAVNLGVIVTEWVTNAFKYAYPSAGGEIRVTLRSLPGGRGELTVGDDGVGLDVGPTIKGTGLGTRLVKSMAQSMDAKIDVLSSASGAVFKLSFPLRRAMSHA
jgi:two-component sensor histidine kinase/CheY-like chemotaxis protein